MRSQKAFTLIELLTVVAIIGILGKLSMSSFYVYRSDAAYSNVQRTLRDMQIAAQAGTLDIDNPPATVPLVSQVDQGPLNDAAARNFLVGFQLPPNMRIQVSYDPVCQTPDCVSGWAQLNHCNATKYVQWLMYGDGSFDTITDIEGAGCS